MSTHPLRLPPWTARQPLNPPPAAATEVALRAADLAYVPYSPTESDHDRATEAVAVSMLAG